MVSGWLKNSLKQKRKSDDSEFNWNDDDQGTITGNIIELREIINAENSPFQSFRIETEINYMWKNCNKKMVKPCPYYYTAFASLFAPIVLALATLSIIICWSKCYKRGILIVVIWFLIRYFFTNALYLDIQNTFGVPGKNLLLLCIFQPFVPFMKFFGELHISTLMTITIYLRYMYMYYAPWLSLIMLAAFGV